MAYLFDPRYQAISASALPYAGAKLHFYQAGTSTPITVYQDEGGTTPHTNPVTADSSGTFPAVFMTNTTNYKIILKDADGVTLDTIDNIPPLATASDLASVVVVDFATVADAEAYAPAVAPEFLRVEGYTSAGDGGGALYRQSESEPAHNGKLSITLADGVTVAWYEIAEYVIDPMMLGALGFVGTKTEWLAELGAGTYTDDYSAIQSAIDILNARGGGELHISRWHASNTPLTVYYGVSIVGDSRWTCGIWKDSTTTKSVTYYQTAAAAQVTIYPGSLPANANAVLILGDSYGSGRWVGRIAGVSLGGTYATVDDWESQKVEFGILSIGSVTDFEINDISVDNAEYGVLIPTPFVGEIANTRITACLSGIGIGNCTTLTMHGNYASDCRDYGFAFRSGKYSSFFANACDLLNTPTRFPDRTRECTAYVFDSCIGMSIFNNGNEQSWGNSFLLNTLRFCSVLNNQTIQVGSDYEGAEDIAVLKITGALVGCVVTGNNGYAEKAGGLIQGSANSAKHHNLFVVAGTVLNASTLHNNVVRSVFSGTDGEAGWGNNVGQEALLVKRGGFFVGTDRNSVYRALIQGMGDTSGTYALGVTNSAVAAILRLRDDGAVFLPSVGSTASGANAVLDGSNSVLKSTSLRAVKDNIEPVTLDEAMAFLQMDAKTFTSLCEADDSSKRLVGFIAEDAEEHAPLLTTHDANGALQGFQYDRAAALHHRIIQYLAQEIERLKASAQ